MSFCPFADTKRASCATFRHHSDPHLVQINMVLPKNSSQQCVTKEANVSDKKNPIPRWRQSIVYLMHGLEQIPVVVPTIRRVEESTSTIYALAQQI